MPAFTSGGEQDTLFLHKPKFFMWLYSINPDKVADNIRPRLVKYQDEVEVAIDRYFTQGVAIHSEQPHKYDREPDDVFSMISSQARMIAAPADEMYRNRKRIENLENDVGHMKDKLYLEYPGPTSTKNHISSQQAQKLKDLAKNKGKTREGMMKLWSKSKKHFALDRYIHLPEERFVEAVIWLENL